MTGRTADGGARQLLRQWRVVARGVSIQYHHEAVLGADNWSDDTPVPAFGPRMVCSVQAQGHGPTARPKTSPTVAYRASLVYGGGLRLGDLLRLVSFRTLAPMLCCAKLPCTGRLGNQMRLSAVLLAVLLVILTFAPASADEGMWTLDDFPANRVEKAYGFAPDRAWLDHVRLSSVRLAFGCSASFVSPLGLVQTNHHCAQGCIAQLSTQTDDLVQPAFTPRPRKMSGNVPIWKSTS
jgi:hypothetical protein